ncbi:MAG: polyprenyl synthetase family protein [Chloroflexi bacterium]|nr:polyprenyl synthetase family protein [Chloroflexota bacterium]
MPITGAQLAPYIGAVEAELRALCQTDDSDLADLFGMMGYHLGWLDEQFQPVRADTGKRLRSLFCLLTCEAICGDWRPALRAATAVELIHNFSLVHDDIEDASETRRHRPTVWKLWGVAQGINIGDALYFLAHVALWRERKLPERTLSRVVRILDEAGFALCQGQYLDLTFEERMDIAVPLYLKMIEGKTAALIAASVQIGAVIGGATEAVAEAYRRFGLEIGLAFQMVDDLLGIWGDPAVTGKPAADDILSRKKSLPIVYALERGLGAPDQPIGRIYRQTQVSADDVGEVLRVLESIGAREYVRAMADERRQKALDALDETGLANPAQEMLRELALAAADRAF